MHGAESELLERGSHEVEDSILTHHPAAGQPKG